MENLSRDVQVMQEYRNDLPGDSNDYYQDYMELLSRFDPELMETVKRRGGYGTYSDIEYL